MSEGEEDEGEGEEDEEERESPLNKRLLHWFPRLLQLHHCRSVSRHSFILYLFMYLFIYLFTTRRWGQRRQGSCVPDGHDVGEEQQETEDLEVPAACKVLQGHHDQGDHQQRPEQDLGQAVHLQIKQSHLRHTHRRSRHSVSHVFHFKRSSTTVVNHEITVQFWRLSLSLRHPHLTLFLGLDVFMTLRSSLPV